MKTINLKKFAIAGAALIGLGTAAITTVNQNTESTTVQAASSKIKVSQSTAVKKFRAKYPSAKIDSINLEKRKWSLRLRNWRFYFNQRIRHED